MNERIKELSEQAEKYADENFRGEPTWSEAFESKLAELIVRECVAEARDDCAGWTERDQCLVMQVMDRIMLHFGVEE